MVASLRRPPGSAAAAEGALQHATARLPTDRGPPRRPRSLGSKFPPQILPPAHTRPLTPGKRSPVNGIKSCSARADRMRPILSRLASHAPQTRVETPPQMLPQPLLGADAFRACEDLILLDEMDIKEALTLALRVRRHQFDANTGNLRSSAQITAFRCIGSDMPTYGSVPHVVIMSMCILHAATKHFSSSAWLCACSVWLCACSAWHLYL